jgi:tRNA pseudouridine38-40 synthase
LRYFIELSYNGNAYHGWQIQRNAHTVQKELNLALEICCRNKSETVGSGSTDAGVHAKQQVCHVDVDKPLDTGETIYKLNTLLPHDIAVTDVYRVSSSAHARFDAVLRSYEYHLTSLKDPFEIDTSYYFRQPLDLTAMNDACKLILGEKDFKSFCKSRTSVDHFNCNIKEAYWKMHNGRHCFFVSANRFLRGMVRALVGTILDIGTGKINVDQFEEILESGDRRRAGRSVPAHGLFLTSVKYPRKILNKT